MPERDALLAEVGELRQSADALSSKLRVSQRVTRLLIAIVAALAIFGVVLTVLVVRGIGENKRTNNTVDAVIARQQATVENQIDATCRTARDIGTLPVTAASKQFTFTLLADFRLQYETNQCATRKGFAPLPAADPRLSPYLPPGVK